MQDLLSLLVELEQVLRPENSAAYNQHSPIPCAFDLKISELIGAYIHCSAEERYFIRDTFSDKYSSTFLFFSQRMACLAVREQSETYLFEGLIAHAIEAGKFDERENMLVLSLVYHSAVKIGADPAFLFKRAADFAVAPIAEIIRKFPDRTPEARSIQAMGYEEVGEAEDFRYQRNW